MSQTTHAFNPSGAFAGMRSDNRDMVVESGIAFEDLDFGLGIVNARAAASPKSVRLPRRNLITLVFSADIVTSNSIAGTVNGVALTATVFATDHLTTITALGAKIVAALAALTVPIVAVATVGGASNRTLTITAEDGHVLVASFVITLGGSQATITLNHNTIDAIRGLSLHSHKGVTGLGVGGVFAKQSVNAARRIRMWVTVCANVVKGDDAYINVATAGKEGQLTNVATNNIATGGKFRSSADGSSTSTIAEVEINLP